MVASMDAQSASDLEVVASMDVEVAVSMDVEVAASMDVELVALEEVGHALEELDVEALVVALVALPHSTHD